MGGWTAERMMNAKPYHPTVSPNLANAPHTNAAAAGPSVSMPGHPPELTSADMGKSKRIAPALPELSAQTEAFETNTAPLQPENIAFQNLPFTTRRVTPGDARVTWPYSAAVKVFFQIQGEGDFVCSGGVVQAREVGLAGHCVGAANLDPRLAHFYQNWLVVPGYDNGNAPYGVWQPTVVATTAAWLFSDGSVPNSDDYALLGMADQNIFGGVHRIAELTGFYGWKTDGILGDNVTILGYPCNLDVCAKLQETTAGNTLAQAASSVVVGSYMEGGASGGPWLINFGVAPVSNPHLPLMGTNQVVGWTSYGPAGTGGFLGASRLGQHWIDMLRLMCGIKAGNCTVTP